MSALERLGRRLAREQDLIRARSTARAQVRERLAELSVPPQRRLGPARLAAGAALALAAAAAVVLWPRARAPEVLVARVATSRTPIAEGAWVEAPASDQPLRLSFSDGTRIDLTPGTRMRIIDVDASGAHLLLESGRAHVAVTPRPGAAWRLSVGPFAVRVIGTRFDVSWDPENDAFRLALSHGKVALSGCVFGDAYTMRVGQAVDASCKRGRFNVHALSDAPPEPRSPAAAPAAQPASAEHEPPVTEARPIATPAPASARRAPEHDWKQLARQRKYDEAFELARETRWRAADAKDLALLAETARHVGADSEEEEALLLIRRRFAGTARAALAAFALGRLEFDRRHAHEKAAQWFGTYLKEQPRGSLAREARGRLIEASLAAGERERAAQLAAQYLELYPSGPHAALARGLCAERAP